MLNKLSNKRNLTFANLSVFLEHQQLEPEVHTNIVRFEIDKLFFFLISGEKRAPEQLKRLKSCSRRQGSIFSKKRKLGNVNIF